MNETTKNDRIKALVPMLDKGEKEVYSEEGAEVRYRKKSKEHILYIRLYLFFFFLGACIFASKKLGSEELSSGILNYVLSLPSSFPDFCVKFAPVVFGSFLIYASGFTMYAPLFTVIYSSVLFLFCGLASGSLVFSFGLSLKSVSAILLFGLVCGICILFCTVTKGISKIACFGIEKLTVSDGMFYSALYIVTVCVQYYIIKGICALIG